MSISTIMSKTIFMKYLLPARPKLVPKLKVHKIDCVSSIKMCGFVLMNGWIVQITTLCLNLALRQKKRFYRQPESSLTLKVACVIMKFSAPICLTVA